MIALDLIAVWSAPLPADAEPWQEQFRLRRLASAIRVAEIAFPRDVERCFICGNPTNHDITGEDSILDAADQGPYCQECWEQSPHNPDNQRFGVGA